MKIIPTLFYLGAFSMTGAAAEKINYSYHRTQNSFDGAPHLRAMSYSVKPLHFQNKQQKNSPAMDPHEKLQGIALGMGAGTVTALATGIGFNRFLSQPQGVSYIRPAGQVSLNSALWLMKLGFIGGVSVFTGAIVGAAVCSFYYHKTKKLEN